MKNKENSLQKAQKFKVRIQSLLFLLAMLMGVLSLKVYTPKKVAISENDHAEIPCKFNGDLKAVYWSKFNVTGESFPIASFVPGPKGGYKSGDGLHLGFDIWSNGSLLIEKMTKQKEGNYSCLAVNEYDDDGSNSTEIKMTKEVSTSEPTSSQEYRESTTGATNDDSTRYFEGCKCICSNEGMNYFVIFLISTPCLCMTTVFSGYIIYVLKRTNSSGTKEEQPGKSEEVEPAMTEFNSSSL